MNNQCTIFFFNENILILSGVFRIDVQEGRSMKYLVVSILLAAGAMVAQADIYSFYSITANDPSGTSQTVGESQFFMDVTATSSGYATFCFTNTGSASSVITEIYFDAPVADPSLGFELVDIINNFGVTFGEIDHRQKTPWNLPEGSPGFIADRGIAAEAPSSQNGINPHEHLCVEVSYDTSYDLLELLENGSFQVGIHAQGLGTGGAYSESFINNIPEPSSLMLSATTMAFVGFLRRKFLI
ncbi:MAG: hypothetical protein ABFR33_01485 [Verrucomicrobiota bacterium]